MALLQRSEFKNARQPLILPVCLLDLQIVMPGAVIPLAASPALWLQIQDALSETAGQMLALGAEQAANGQGYARDAIGCLIEVNPVDTELTGCNSQQQPLVILKGLKRVQFQLLQSPLGETWCAEIIPVTESHSDAGAIARAQLRQALIELLLKRCPELAIREMTSLLESELSLGQLCDLAVIPLALSVHEQIHILKTLDVDMRCRALLRFAQSAPRARSSFHGISGLN